MAIKMIALILGGGAGNRLYPLTDVRSKPAVPIGGKYRLIDIPISNCLNSGVRRMFVLTQFNSASLNRHIKNSYQFDIFSRGFVDILAAEQTHSSKSWYQGTADAVRQSMHHLVNHDHDYILVLSGDQLYQMNYETLAKYHVSDQKADITIATIPVTDQDAPGFGIMKVNEKGLVESFKEKPKTKILPKWQSAVEDKYREQGKLYLASMGIYVFKKQVLIDLFKEFPDATDFGKEIIPNAISKGMKIASYAFGDYWTDIGTIRSFFEANLALTDNIPEFNLFDDKNTAYTRPRLLAPSKIFGTQFYKALLAEGCIVHAAKVERSIIGIRSRIGKDTVITHSIVMGNDYFETLDEIQKHEGEDAPMGIGNNCHIENTIVDKNCRIGNNVRIFGGTLPDEETSTYCIKEGIVVLKKGAHIPSGTVIGSL